MEQQTVSSDIPTSGRGVFVVLEGLANDHAELMKRLHAELVAANLPAIVLFEPSQGDLTTQTLATVLEDTRFPKNARVHTLLDNTVLAQQYEAVRATTASGTHCIAGRGSLTNLVTGYYGMGVTDDYHTMNTVVDFAAGKQIPTLTIVFDTPVDELTTQTIQGLALPVPAGQQNSFLERMRAGYLWEANQHGFPIVFASSDINAMFTQVWDHVSRVLKPSNKPANTTDPKSVAEVLAARPPHKTAPSDPPQTPPPTLGVTDPEAPAKTENPVQQAPAKAAEPETISTPVGATVTVSTLLLATLRPQPSVVTADLSYDQKNGNGHYAYYIPADLKGKVRSQYIRSMNQIFDNYGTLKTRLQAYAEKTKNSLTQEIIDELIRPVLPLAATVAIKAPEGSSKPIAARHVLPEAMELGLASNGDNTFDPAVQSMADSLLPPNHTPVGQSVQLTRYTPRNELDLVAEVLYPFSDLSFETLENTAGSWTYEQKVSALELGLQTEQGEVLAGVLYSFDVVTSFTALQKLRAQSAPIALTTQTYTPRLGYAVPTVIEEAGLSELYEQCFDISLELHSALHATKGPILAQYGVLQGHVVRGKLTLKASDVAHLLSDALQQVDQSYRTLVGELHTQVTEVHPLLAGNMQSSATP